MVRVSVAVAAVLLAASPAVAQRYVPYQPYGPYRPYRAYPAYPPYQPYQPVRADPAYRPDQPAEEQEPAPPPGAAVGYVPPAHDNQGYRTVNRDLTASETVWHVRVALNVAALGCRDGGEMAAAYNDLLAAERAPLAEAATATRALYRVRRGGPAWEAAYDDDMTRLYNYWAQPPAHEGFCATAAALLREARQVSPEAFAAFAAAALPRLEAPFTTFYLAYDDYRARLGAWRERRPTMVIATAAPVPMGPGEP